MRRTLWIAALLLSGCAAPLTGEWVVQNDGSTARPVLLSVDAVEGPTLRGELRFGETTVPVQLRQTTNAEDVWYVHGLTLPKVKLPKQAVVPGQKLVVAAEEELTPGAYDLILMHLGDRCLLDLRREGDLRWVHLQRAGPK